MTPFVIPDSTWERPAGIEVGRDLPVHGRNHCQKTITAHSHRLKYTGTKLSFIVLEKGIPDINEVKKMKKGFAANLEEETRKNTDFRRVLYTGKYSQLVLMCLKPKEDIGMETHDDVDQFFRFEEGEGVVVIDETKHTVKDGSGVIVPSGAKHNVTNTSATKNLKLYTIYSPPEHQDKVIRKTKQEAVDKEEHYDGKPTEK